MESEPAFDLIRCGVGSETSSTHRIRGTIFTLAKLRSLAKGLTFSRLHLKPYDQLKRSKVLREHLRFDMLPAFIINISMG